MGKYFGTDGFRGEANINLTVEHEYKELLQKCKKERLRLLTSVLIF